MPELTRADLLKKQKQPELTRADILAQQKNQPLQSSTPEQALTNSTVNSQGQWIGNNAEPTRADILKMQNQPELTRADLLKQRMPPQSATPEQPLITQGVQPVKNDDADTRKNIVVKQAMGEKLQKEDFENLYDLSQQDKKIMDEGFGAGLPQITAEEYLNFTPDQRMAYDQAAYRQQAGLQQSMLDEQVTTANQLLQDKISRQQQDLIDAQSNEEIDSRLDQMRELQEPELARAKNDIQQAEERVMKQQAWAARSRGQGAGTGMMQIMGDITASTQDKIAAVEDSARRELFNYETQLLAKQDEKIQKIRDRLEVSYDESSEQQLRSLQAQQELTANLIAQDPTNPTNIKAAAESLQKQRLEEMKLEQAERKMMQEQASKNFEFMVDNFGSSWIKNMTPEQKVNYASNLGVNPIVLENIGATQEEQNREWEQMKYISDQDFEMNKLQYLTERDRENLYLEHGLKLEIMDQSFNYDVNMENIKRAAGQESNGYGPIGAGITSQYVSNSTTTTPNAAFFAQPIMHPQAGVEVVQANTKVQEKYPEGYQFAAANKNDLTGQCKWFSQQITTLDNGQGWTIGSTAADTNNNLNAMINKGQAFKVGQEPIKVGQTLITNDSPTYWHSATVSAITPDGKLVLTEANYKGPLKVSHSRVLDPNSSSIQGILKTKFKPTYQFSQADIEKANVVKNTPAYNDIDTPTNVLRNVYSTKPDVANAQIERLNTLLQEGKVDEAKSVVQSAINANLPTGMFDNLTTINESIGNYGAIIEEIDSLKKKGKDTGFWNIGLGVNQTLENVGFGDPEIRKLNSQFKQIMQQYRSALSGAAFSEQEAAEYEQLFPSLSKTAQQNITDLQALDEVFKRKRDNIYNAGSSGLYPNYNSFNKAFTPQSGSTGQISQAITGGINTGLDFLNRAAMQANYQAPQETFSQQDLDSI